MGDKDLTKKAQALSMTAKTGRQQQQQFNNLVWEVLRFHPVNPVVFRYIEKDTELSGVKMKAKSHIIIATQAAILTQKLSQIQNPSTSIVSQVHITINTSILVMANTVALVIMYL